jgi:hypothetical protein
LREKLYQLCSPSDILITHHYHTINKGAFQFSLRAGGSYLPSKGGSLLVSAEGEMLNHGQQLWSNHTFPALPISKKVGR